MGRKALGARVKVDYRDGTVLYAWRPRPGAMEIAGKGPGGEANVLLFRAYVLKSWEEGIEPSTPGTYLSTSVPVSAPAVPSEPKCSPTLREWIGNPAKGKPGRYFDFANSMGRSQEDQYERAFRLHGAFEIIGDLPLSSVTSEHATQVRDRVLRCPVCVERGLSLNPPRKVSDGEARADRPSFDKQECPSHHPANLLQRTSVERYISLLKAAFNGAVRAKIINENPFVHVRYGKWASPGTNDDLRVSLTHPQLDALVNAHPKELRVVPVISVTAMLRREEMWGLQRVDFSAPPENPAEDPSTVTFKLARVWMEGEKRFRPWGKTTGSMSELITIGSEGVSALNNHLRHYMAPSERCAACSRGDGIWRGASRRNPHLDCGFANNAPLVPYALCSAERYTKVICRQAQVAANLSDLDFDITHQSYRSTGAVQYLDAGVPISTVVKMGRWTNSKTLLKHYNRPNLEQHIDAVISRDRARAAELGIDTSDEAPAMGRLRFLKSQVDSLIVECDELALENAELRRQLSLSERSHRAEIVPVPLSNQVPGAWDVLSDHDLRSVIVAGVSQRGILDALGLSAAGKNYRRLRLEAKRLSLELPAPHASLRVAVGS